MDVERITSAHVDAAAFTLGRAFAADPVFVWMARDRVHVPDRLAAGFRSNLEAELRKSEPELFVAAGGGCAAIWHGIDAWKSTPAESIRVLPAFARVFGLGIGRVLRTVNMVEKSHPTVPHYHLAFVGTDPSRQGCGLGTAVLEPMLKRCDAEGVPAYLENSNPRNEAFYVRHGFVPTGPIPLPKGAPAVTAMWRTPRTS